MTLGQQNDQIIGLHDYASEVIFYGKIPSSCVEALQSIMSKGAL
jgi:hypothetical protein